MSTPPYLENVPPASPWWGYGEGGSGSQGPEGPQGPQGPQGPKGDPGDPGPSAYEVAASEGFEGTEQQWLDSLKGADGAPGSPGSAGAKGDEGDSAYEVAVANGFVGNEAAWLESLVGEQGPKGDPGAPGSGSGVESYDEISGLPDYPSTFPADLSGLADVATSGSYDDLDDKPTIPSVSGLASETYVDNAVGALSVGDLANVDDAARADGDTLLWSESENSYVPGTPVMAGVDAEDITSGTLDLARMPSGSMFQVIWDGSDWTLGGTVVTTRGSSRTDIHMWAVGGTAQPSFMIAGDMWLEDVS